ncbi:MAG: PD-(D/E)XK nuclease family protein [Acidimicrobiia bacterium]|nr:PD-(D/E)XK nuclease family protein [Acidimicrobiia bacterium]
MITSRRIRLLRTPDLAGYRSALVDAVRSLDASTAPDTFILVPTTAAAKQLRRTIGERLGDRTAWPPIGMRADLYALLIDRLPSPPRLLSSFEREAMLAAGGREAEEAGAPPPFHVRPALVADMLSLYDQVRRAGRSIDDFDRLLSGELEPAAESDRGAAQLLEQTRFLACAFSAYEQRLRDGGAADEHAARALLMAAAPPTPLRRLIVAIGDRPFDADGYWPADVTLWTAMPGLEHLDLLATNGSLEGGYLDRLRLSFVELEEVEAGGGAQGHGPTLMVPDEGVAYCYRDREDELEGVARRLRHPDEQAAPVAELDKVGLIVARPLPYLYLAREVFAGAGLPFLAVDTLPLAAEPYAAAVDLVLECAAANFTRRATIALLRSPHFQFTDDETAFGASVAALNRVMAEQRYLGGLDRLRSLVTQWTGVERAAAEAAVTVADTLEPLQQPRPMVDQIERLRAFLSSHDRDHRERRRRARAAVDAALAGLSESYRRHDPSMAGSVVELSAAVRRWIGAETFASDTGDHGLRILDAQAARFADLDEAQILGLVEGEWPERPRRNVFYPRALLAQLEPSRPERVTINDERDQVRSARAAFRDLLGLPRVTVRLSTFALESDAVVEPSSFLEEVGSFALPTQKATEDRQRPAFAYETLATDPLGSDSAWARLRANGAARDRRRFEGEAGAWTLPRVSVSRLERYMKCPFQFYVANVLQVGEEPEDEMSRSPLERGRFLHELFEAFFHEWQGRGQGRITAASMGDARALFEEIAGPALRSLPPEEAALERARLFGSAVGSGIADRVFAMEAERGDGIRQRLMEYELDGVFSFTGEDGSSRDVRLRAKIDRVDLLEDGTFRLIDYKTKYVPDRREALQLPIYSACVRSSLRSSHGRDIPASEAMYLSFEGPRAVVPLDPSTRSGPPRATSKGEERGHHFDDLVAAAGHRLVAALDNIAAGHFPARPETKNLCTMCAFTAVCRNVGGAPEHG